MIHTDISITSDQNLFANESFIYNRVKNSVSGQCMYEELFHEGPIGQEGC